MGRARRCLAAENRFPIWRLPIRREADRLTRLAPGVPQPDENHAEFATVAKVECRHGGCSEERLEERPAAIDRMKWRQVMLLMALGDRAGCGMAASWLPMQGAGNDALGDAAETG